MATRKKIVKFCEDYLKVSDFKDYCVNGLQVEGKEEVKKIVAGVSFSKKLIKAAIEKNADMILVHHGLFVNPIGSPPSIKGVTRNRLKLLLQNDISLIGFHLPLDAHPIVGNNIGLAKILGLKKTKPFYVGYCGELEKAIDFEKFVALLEKKLDTKTIVKAEGKKKVKKIGIVSGGASPSYEEAKELGMDVFICGDIREEVVRGIEEAEINFINAGHYNTEKLGVQNLGKLISKKFGIKVEFVDIPCDV